LPFLFLPGFFEIEDNSFCVNEFIKS